MHCLVNDAELVEAREFLQIWIVPPERKKKSLPSTSYNSTLLALYIEPSQLGSLAVMH